MDNSIINRIKGELKTFEEKKKALVDELRKEFPNLLQPLLEQSEIIESISWVQYTPYFNDGDECTFSSYAADFGFNGKTYRDNFVTNADFWSKEIYDYTSGRYKKVPNPGYIEKEASIIDGLSEILSEIPDDFYKDLFGDHVEITIFKDGRILINSYAHD